MSKLARYAHFAESYFDRFRPKRGDGELLVEPYLGYSTLSGVVVRGRILEETTLNFLDQVIELSGTPGSMLSNFLTREVSGVEIQLAQYRTISDEEGYFSFEFPFQVDDLDSLNIRLPRTGDEFSMPVISRDPDASHAVISDIDDTVIETGAWQLIRNLWTTFTTPSEERVVFEDTVGLINNRMGNFNPVFYVSSSPWNLHQYLLEIFKRGNVPLGPIFLRDLGIDHDKFIKSSHGSHKGNAIDLILNANPDLTFTLIGDTGQQDGEVYLNAIEMHPGRIAEVCLRNAGELSDTDLLVAEKIKETGVSFFSGPTFDPVVLGSNG